MPLRRSPTKRLTVPDRELLLTPLFSNVPESLALLEDPAEFGLLDGESLRTLEETKRLLQQVLRTANATTIPVFGSGGAATEAAVANLLEAPAEVLVLVGGRDGRRIADYADQYGHRVTVAEIPTVGDPDLEPIRERLGERPYDLVAAVHGESSTGLGLDVAAIGELVHAAGNALYLVDAASTAAGQELLVDAWGIDVCVAGVQRCLNCPPGLAVLSLNARALERYHARETPVVGPSASLDEIMRSVGGSQAFHHSIPAGSIYSLHAACSLVLSEGLENRWRRHADVSAHLVGQLEAVGCRAAQPSASRLHTITAVLPPAGENEARLRRDLLEMFRIEIGCEWEEVADTLWLVATMGINATRPIAEHLADCLDIVLRARDAGPVGGT